MLWSRLAACSQASNCLACCWLGQPKGRSIWAGLMYMASKGLGWTCGSHYEFGMSSFQSAVGASPAVALPPPAPHFDEVFWSW
jgi:hypothetical protein